MVLREAKEPVLRVFRVFKEAGLLANSETGKEASREASAGLSGPSYSHISDQKCRKEETGHTANSETGLRAPRGARLSGRTRLQTVLTRV